MLLLFDFEERLSRSREASGGLAQLARAPALHAGGHRFDSDILHRTTFSKVGEVEYTRRHPVESGGHPSETGSDILHTRDHRGGF